MRRTSLLLWTAHGRRTVRPFAKASEPLGETPIQDRTWDSPWSLGGESGAPYYTENTVNPRPRMNPEVAMLLRGQPHEHLLAEYFAGFAHLSHGELVSYVRNVLADDDVLEELVDLERRARIARVLPALRPSQDEDQSPLLVPSATAQRSPVPTRYQFLGADVDGEAIDVRRSMKRLMDRRVGPVFDAPEEHSPVWQSESVGGNPRDAVVDEWRPNHELHREHYNWLPLKDRIFQERAAAAPEARAYVPPIEGDEELAAGEYEAPEMARDRLLEEAAGEQSRSAPLILPTVRERKVDRMGRASGHGGRKTASAQVWVQPSVHAAAADGGAAAFRVNGRPMAAYFSEWAARDKCLAPLMVTDTLGSLDVFVGVRGGGVSAQAEAIRLGLARALQHLDPAHRPTLKEAGMLTRDPRQVERKKPGLRKARKRKQWSKR